MLLSTLDWIIIISFFAFSLAIGLYFRKRAGKNLISFFLGGRNMPWWLAGISMVATTFAADTPLAVTELVAKSGISGNWLWWNMLAGGMLTTFFFARLWRRAEVLTEVELVELRYSGKEAAVLRGFKAIYLGLFMNVLVIGWVNIALASLLQVFFGLSEDQVFFYLAVSMVIAAIYSGISGLWGVAVTDLFQFVIAMAGSVILAILVIQSPEIGGISGLVEKVPSWSLDFFPTFSSVSETGSGLAISAGAFLAYAGVQWWASWYPGAEPGGGGYVAQRMMSTKTEQGAVYATLLFQVMHYCLRPWPWILVSLACIVLYPELQESESRLGYVYAMKDFLPAGLKGLMLTAFFAAYLSTISTQLNWGAGYLVNDFYKRFVNPQMPDQKLVFVSRITTLLLMAIGLFTTTFMTSISGVWEFILECGAGLGLVLILRWYWWRVNAWSEIAASIAPFLIYGIIKIIESFLLNDLYLQYPENPPQHILDAFYQNHPWLTFPGRYFIIVGLTTIIWIATMYFTKPTERNHLERFYQRVRPEGFWPGFKEENNKDKKIQLPWLFLAWISAIVFTYSLLFLSGKFILNQWNSIWIYAVIAIVSLLILTGCMRNTKILS